MTNTPRSGPVERVSPGGLAVWGAALIAYVFAVFARTSLSATGIDAAVRFHATAAQLSLFAVLQLGVYAAMQIPAGATVDRIGARKAIAIGSVAIGLGQVAIAFAGDVPTAIAARVLVGSGDAFIFLSVVRLIPAWFPSRHVAVVTQLSGVVGQLGQLLSLGPLVGLLHARGWTAAFASAGSVTVLVGLLVLLSVRDGRTHQIIAVRPAGSASGSPTASSVAPARGSPGALGDEDRGSLLARTWRNPGTRAGFWVHFTSQFSANTFAMLWGFAYMTRAEHVSASVALKVLGVYVFGCMVFGPALGVISGKLPSLRVRLVVAVVAAHVVVWTTVLAWPGRAPALVLFALAVVLSTGGPASLVGFDLMRRTVPLSTMGLATGMVNAGGFISSLVAVLAVGVVLDLVGEGTPELFTDGGFALAWLVQAPLWLLGLVMLRRALPAYRRHSGL